MENISRRKFLYFAPLLLSGCGLGRMQLPTNTAQNFKEKDIHVSEDIINMQKTGILGNYYFAIPLNNETRILSGGEPSYALIPETKSRISIKQVGEKGGEVIVDAPAGDLYLPYVCVTDGKKHKLSTNFSNVKPVRFITNFKMEEIVKPNKKYGKIDLEKMTEKDLPFSDETLSTLGNNQYLVNRADDMFDSNALPIYFTKLPIGVEYNRVAEDNKIRIVGDSYVFAKGQTIDAYVEKRGFTNPVEEQRKAMEAQRTMYEQKNIEATKEQKNQEVENRKKQSIGIDTKN